MGVCVNRIGTDYSNAETDFGRFSTTASNGDTFTAPRSDQSTDEFGVQLFGLKFFSQTFIQGSLGAAYMDSNIDRFNLSIQEPDGVLYEEPIKTSGDTDGYNFSAFFGVGNIVYLTPRVALILAGGLDTTYFKTDGYQEKIVNPTDLEAGDTPALKFEDDDSVSVTSVIEVTLQTMFQIAGLAFQPSIGGGGIFMNLQMMRAILNIVSWVVQQVEKKVSSLNPSEQIHQIGIITTLS